MPQELQVLQCYNCDTYQVQIIKKVPKWVCKMCGEKQSVKKILGKGTGKECRLFVQNLNEIRIKSQDSSSIQCASTVTHEQSDSVLEDHDSKKESKWLEFIDNRENEDAVFTATESKGCIRLRDLADTENTAREIGGCKRFKKSVDEDLAESASKWAGFCNSNRGNSNVKPTHPCGDSIFYVKENSLDVLLEI